MASLRIITVLQGKSVIIIDYCAKVLSHPSFLFILKIWLGNRTAIYWNMQTYREKTTNKAKTEFVQFYWVWNSVFGTTTFIL